MKFFIHYNSILVATVLALYACKNDEHSNEISSTNDTIATNPPEQNLPNPQQFSQTPPPEIQKPDEEQIRKTYAANITFMLQDVREYAKANNYEPSLVAAYIRKSVNRGDQLPSDFSVSVVDNMHAWEQYAALNEAIQKLNTGENVTDIIASEMISRALELDEHPLSDAQQLDARLRQAAQESNDQINSTFRVIEKIAISYGAKLPT